MSYVPIFVITLMLTEEAWQNRTVFSLFFPLFFFFFFFFSFFFLLFFSSFFSFSFFSFSFPSVSFFPFSLSLSLASVVGNCEGELWHFRFSFPFLALRRACPLIPGVNYLGGGRESYCQVQQSRFLELRVLKGDKSQFS